MWEINKFIRFWSGTDRNSGHIPCPVPGTGFRRQFRTGWFCCFFRDRYFPVRLIFFPDRYSPVFLILFFFFGPVFTGWFFLPGRNFPVRCFLLAYIAASVLLTGTGSGGFLIWPPFRIFLVPHLIRHNKRFGNNVNNVFKGAGGVKIGYIFY